MQGWVQDFPKGGGGGVLTVMCGRMAVANWEGATEDLLTVVFLLACVFRELVILMRYK